MLNNSEKNSMRCCQDKKKENVLDGTPNSHQCLTESDVQGLCCIALFFSNLSIKFTGIYFI